MAAAFTVTVNVFFQKVFLAMIRLSQRPATPQQSPQTIDHPADTVQGYLSQDVAGGGTPVALCNKALAEE